MARILQGRGGMNPTPSPWFLTGLVLGALTAGVLYAVQAIQQALPLP